jgi:hypothetical protein
VPEEYHISADELNTVNAIPAKLSDVITEITLGNQAAARSIYVYISPSCLHCGYMLVEKVVAFAKSHGDKCRIIVKLLPTSAKDLFIMKLIQNETSNKARYFEILQNYTKRALAALDKIEPSEEQKKRYKVSDKDAEMIKYQVLASEFGFSDEQIQKACPNMSGKYEIAIMKKYKETVAEAANLLQMRELDLPLIVRDGKAYKDIDDAVD